MEEDKYYFHTFFNFVSQPLYFRWKGSPKSFKYKAGIAAEPISTIWEGRGK
jgi:hypothetical protein